MEKKNVILEKRDGVATIIINRPEKRNSLSEATAHEILSIYEKIRHDSTIGAVIDTAVGDTAFCAGMDVNDLKRYYERPDTEAQSAVIKLDEVIRNFPKVTIAAVNGYCLGAAITFLISHDLTIASEENANFGLPEIFRGFPPKYVIGALFRAIPVKLGFEMLLTGKNWDAKKAQTAGLVNRVVPHAELRDTAFQWAKEIIQSDWVTLEFCKQCAHATMDQPTYAQAIQVSGLWHTEHSRQNPRALQGLRDFIAKKGKKAND